jgi:hypothetical protein
VTLRERLVAARAAGDQFEAAWAAAVAAAVDGRCAGSTRRVRA